MVCAPPRKHRGTDSQLIVAAASRGGSDKTTESVTVLPDVNASLIHQDKVTYIEHLQRMSRGVLLRMRRGAREQIHQCQSPLFYGHPQSADGFDSNLRQLSFLRTEAAASGYRTAEKKACR